MNEESIFRRAASMESDEDRSAFLDDACGSDAPLRNRIENLLQQRGESERCLKDSAGAAPGGGGVLPTDQTIGGDPDVAGLGTGPQGDATGDSGTSDPNASVLMSLEQHLNTIPRVALKEPAQEADGPIVRPNSPEVPRGHVDRRYQLQGEIARGGMGAIIKGRDNDLGRELAIKVLLDSHKRDSEVVERFVEEAQIGGQLQHPGVVPVYELGQFSDNRPFFSMKLVKGKTLSSQLTERKDPGENRAQLLGIFEQVCQTMAYAHSRGVIHRDLKPANIMVGAFGEVQVMDWGLAKVLSEGGVADEQKAVDKQPPGSIIRTRRSAGSDTPDRIGSQTLMGSVMGTPAYMPPEQALGEVERLDERADVFGLGAILCEILTGKPPYIGDGAQVFRDARRGKLDECHQRLDQCQADAPLIELARQSLAAEPEARPRDAGQLAERITSYLAGVQDRLKQAEIGKAKAQTRRKLLAAIAAILFVVAAAAGIAAVRFRDQSEQNKTLAKQARAAETTAAAERDRALGAEERATASAREAHRLLYNADMNLAHQSLKMNNLGRAIRLLDRHRPQDSAEDIRGWEWRYIWQLTRSSALAKLTERKARCLSLDYSSAGDLLVAGWMDGHVQLWDTRKRELVRTLVEAGGAARAQVAFSPVANLVAATSGSEQVSLYDLDSGRDSVIWRPGILGDWRVRDIAFSRDGSRLVLYVESLRPQLARGVVINVGESKVESQHATTSCYTYLHGAARLSPDNKRLYLARSGGTQYSIKCVDLEKGDELWKTEPLSDFGLTCLDVSPDGAVVASGSGFEDSTIRIWDCADGRLLRELKGHTGWVSEIAFTRDGRRLISSAADQTIRTWDTATWKQMRVLRGNTDEIGTVARDGSGQLVASGSRDGKILLWEADEKEASDGYVQLPDSVQRVYALDDSRLLLINERDDPPAMIDLRKSSSPTALEALGASSHILGASGDKLVFRWTASGSIVVDELQQDKWIQRAEIETPSGMRPLGGVNNASGMRSLSGVVYNHERQLLAWIGGALPRTKVHIVSLEQPDKISTLSSDKPLGPPLVRTNDNYPPVSADGKYVAAYTRDRSIRVWSIESRELVPIDAAAGLGIVDMDYSAGGRSLVALLSLPGQRHDVRFYDLLKPESPATSVLGKNEVIRTLAVAPDGGQVATSSYVGIIRLFDAATSELTGKLHGHLTAAHDVEFSPDGRRLISTSGGMETLKLWDVRTRQEMLTLEGSGSVLNFARWSNDGNVLIAGPRPWQAWRAPTWEEIEAAER